MRGDQTMLAGVVDEEQIYYNFYEKNRHRATVRGRSKAESFLDDICVAWQLEHGNFWSDDGAVEAAFSAAAPHSNLWYVMDQWLADHPGWRYSRDEYQKEETNT